MLILRYPTLAGVPPGGSQPCVDATASIAFGRPYHTYYNSLAHSFLSVARVLLLLHVPRFPFHDSTGVENPLFFLRKTIHSDGVLDARFQLDRQGPSGSTFGVHHGTSQGSKNFKEIH